MLRADGSARHLSDAARAFAKGQRGFIERANDGFFESNERRVLLQVARFFLGSHESRT
jgi:hypothetical protein